jgi:hypothetical protein
MQPDSYFDWVSAELKPHRIVLSLGCIAFTGLTCSQETRQSLGDPFVQVTSSIKSCPVPTPSEYTQEEACAQSHYRIERGTSCYQSGRCRLPNSYAYDVDIIARVQKFIRQDDRFTDSSIWIEGQRRWVTLMGCVNSASQQAELESAVRLVDDVENVVSVLDIVGSSSK